VLSEGIAVGLKGSLSVYSSKSSLICHIAPISFGAASLSGRAEEGDIDGHDRIQWHNVQAPGATLVESGDRTQQDLVVLAVCVWLISQQKTRPSGACSSSLPRHGLVSERGRLVYVAQALPAILTNNHLSLDARMEALHVLNEVDGSTAVNVCETTGQTMVAGMREPGALSTRGNNLLAQEMFDICMEQIMDNASSAQIGVAFHAASVVLPLLLAPVVCATRVLAAFTFVMNLPPAIRLRQVGRRSVQARISLAVVECMRLVDVNTVSNVVTSMGAMISRMQKVGVSERLSVLTAVSACVGSAYPATAGKLIARYLAIGDGIVDAMLLCSVGPSFMLACMIDNGAVREHISASDVAVLLSAALRRMGLGRGPPRHAAARLLVSVCQRDGFGPTREVVLSALLPVLSRDAGTVDGSRSASDALAQLARADADAFRFQLSKQPSDVRCLVESLWP
jgi:hypothetical protein